MFDEKIENYKVGEVCSSVARKVTNDQWLTIKKSMDQKVPLKIKRGYLSVCPPKKKNDIKTSKYFVD